MTFDYAYAYEDRDEIHTSRWALDGVNTTDSGNITDGRLWFTASDSDDTVTVNVYKDAACAGDTVATGTADISGIADAPAKCTLAAANSSGLSGEFYFEEYTTDPTNNVEVLVSLAMDVDLELEYASLSDLPDYHGTTGMAKWLGAATRKTLLQVSQLYKEDLGGFGAPESRYRLAATRTTPDYRCIANPDQLQEACVHWALMMAMGARHQRAKDTMYSDLRDYHDAKRAEAIQGWNLAINTDPSDDDDADESQHAGFVPVIRL